MSEQVEGTGPGFGDSPAKIGHTSLELALRRYPVSLQMRDVVSHFNRGVAHNNKAGRLPSKEDRSPPGGACRARGGACFRRDRHQVLDHPASPQRFALIKRIAT